MHMIEILLWIAILSGLLQVFYWIYCSYNLTISKRQSNHIIAKEVPVSIIICAYNEGKNLSKNLRFFLEQKNIITEVIVVNDHSTDNSLEVLTSFKSYYPHLKILSLEGPALAGKKSALTAGIQAAQYESILVSDADCMPESEYWAFNMSQYFDKHHDLISGYSPFKSSKSLVNAYARFENLITALQYIGFGSGHLPYMAVGRNMGYTASLIKKIEYFGSHSDVMAGDDDLTVQAAVKVTAIRYVLHPETFVLTESAVSWKRYCRQKMRHYSVSPRYELKYKIVLGSFGLSWIVFYTACIVFCLLGMFKIAGILIISRWCLIIPGFIVMKNCLSQKLSFGYILIFDACFPFFMGILAIFGALKSKPTWK